MKKVIFLTYIMIIFLTISLSQTEAGLFDWLIPDSPVDNLVINIHGPNILRLGDIPEDKIVIRTVITNNNSDIPIIINKIKILNSNNEIVRDLNINTPINPIKEEIIEAKKLTLQKRDVIVESNKTEIRADRSPIRNFIESLNLGNILG